MVRCLRSGLVSLFIDECFAAKLAISIARKMNALIFLVPEDIVDVRPRLVCTFLRFGPLVMTDGLIRF